jgi:integrase
MGWAKPRTSGKRTRYTAAYRDAAGRERSAGTYDTKREAVRKAREAEGKIEQGSWTDPCDGKMTFREYAETRWLPSLVDLEVNTLAGYRSYLRVHFLPALGDLPMSGIVPATVQAWVNSVSGKTVAEGGLSASSVHHCHAMLHVLFKQAVVDKIVPLNPCTDTRLPKVPSQRVRAKRRRYLTPEEYESILDYLSPMALLLTELDIETGARWGEVAGLRLGRVDRQQCIVHIEQVLIEVAKKDSPTGERFIFKDMPKDDEPRSVRISRDLTEAIYAYAEERGIGPDDLLFTSKCGGPLSRSNYRNREWLPAIEAADLGFQPTVRDLRHAHASWAVNGGADLKAVQERLGHAHLSTTQCYVHTLPESDAEALAAFQKVRNRSKPTNPTKPDLRIA